MRKLEQIASAVLQVRLSAPSTLSAHSSYQQSPAPSEAPGQAPAGGGTPRPVSQRLGDVEQEAVSGGREDQGRERRLKV